MGREKEGYRDNYAMLNDRFPDKDMLSKADISAVTGWCYRTVVKRIRFGKTGQISKADLARQISV